LIEAFKELVIQVNSKSMEEQKRMKEKLIEALGDVAQLIVLLVPQLERLIGKQQEVEELAPEQAKNRLMATIVRFLRVFTDTSGCSLVLFIDDIQWADGLSMAVMSKVLNESPAVNVSFVCLLFV
jgi:predicted ATPase